LILNLIIGAALAGMSVALLLRAFALRGAAGQRVEEIRGYGFGAAAEVEPLPAGRFAGALDETAGRIGRWAARHLGSFREEDLRTQLMIAGLYTTSPLTFLGYRVLAAIAVPALFVWIVSLAGLPAVLVLLVGGIGALCGWVLPMTYLRRKVAERYDLVERDLPELVDLLVLTVEAGLGFNGALQLASNRLHGPLGDELRLTLQEQSMGLPINAALANLLGRCETPSMRSFVRSVIQGETLGVSIGAILRSLAIEMRKRRHARAEERAQKAPIKILFPLVFLIFPSLFAVLLFPAVSQFLHSIG
jgi:tight adherence protein C